MTDRIDQEGRTSFVQTLPRKVTELRATLGTLIADPKSQRMRDELRRRLHALYTLTRSYNLPALSEGLREGIAHLDAVRGATALTDRDLETLADLIASLPALAQRDLPDHPELFLRPRDRGPGSRPVAPLASHEAGAATGTGSVAGSVPPSSTGAGTAVSAGTVVQGDVSGQLPLLGVLVVGGAGLVQEVKRALPTETEVTAVRTLAEAIAAARDTAPDVIVAECAAPADGLGLLAALRGDPLTDFLPVVLLTDPSDGIDPASVLAQGAAEVLTLPVDTQRLKQAIERASQGILQPSVPPPAFGEVTLEELTRTLQEEIRRGILGAAGSRFGHTKVPLGEGSEVLAATWEAIARVREVIEKKSRGRVRFELPAVPLGPSGAHVLAIHDDDEPSESEETSMDDPLPGRRALVVDDDPGVVWFFAGLLREAGMEVTECTDGAQALQEARRVRPDVIVSDILMPGVDGFALCRAIRRDVSLRHTPVILLSWKEDLLVRMRELGAQAQGFLRKESKGEAILARLRAVLRPRVRILQRIESLSEGTELRGRVERVGVVALLETAARALRDATLAVTDSFSVTELDLRDGQLVSVVRTAQDGSLVRGEVALMQVLGTSNARFTLRRARHPVRANVQGDLSQLLAGGAALITALEEAVSGAALLEVASMDLDVEAARAYARSLPEALRVLVDRIARGESPRDLVLRDGIAPRELESILVELARRGTIRGVRGQQGEDLVALHHAAVLSGRGTEVGRLPKDSGTLPAVLQVPEEEKSGQRSEGSEESPPSEQRNENQSTTTTTNEQKTPAWTPPSTIEEAAKPGFGLEGERDSLADAVLRELSEPPPRRDENLTYTAVTSPGREDASIGPKDNAPAVAAGVASSEREGGQVRAHTESEETADSGKETPSVSLQQASEDTVGSGKETMSVETRQVSESALSNETKSVEKRQASEDTVGSGEKDDTPEFEETTSEEVLTEEEIEKAAQATGLPLEGVELDARGLPRRRVTTNDLPRIDPPPSAVRPEKVATSSQSIVVDQAAVGAPVEVVENVQRSARPDGTKEKDARISRERQRTASPWLVIAVVAVGLASYIGMRLVLQMTEGAGGSVQSQSDVGTNASMEGSVDGSVAVGPSAEALSVTAPTLAEGGVGVTDASAERATSGFETMSDEDPSPYLDGGTLAAGQGLLVIEGSGEITVDRREIGRGPVTVPVAAGTHTVTYRRGEVTGFRVVSVPVGRALRVVLPAEP